MSEQKSDFPPQEQQPPGLTGEMRPRPDHGEDSYTGSDLLTGRRALITGGDSGIGRAVAIAFAREGADVAIGYLAEEEADARETLDLIGQAGRTAVGIAADLTTRDACRQTVKAAVAGLGGLDILVNNAGFHFTKGDSGKLKGLEPQLVERVLQLNFAAVLWLSQAALPHLGEGSAINSITVNLAEQLGPKGIRVNAVAPGPIWTPLQPATRDAEEVSTFGSDTPLGRAGQPAEVAPAFVFLASERTASYVSGTILGVTGGKATF